MRGYLDYFNLALHWLCPTAPHLLRRVAAGMDRGGRFYQSEWPLRQGTRGRWRGLYAGSSFYAVFITNLVSAVTSIIDIIEKLLFIGLGVKALNQGTITAPVVDKLVSKYMD